VRLATNVQKGQVVLITGALGGVGRAAVHTAKKIGAQVIAGVRGKSWMLPAPSVSLTCSRLMTTRRFGRIERREETHGDRLECERKARLITWEGRPPSRWSRLKT
jgi:NAD(P)-dependent dehydrogenase (short-subunit alcohol dehydrogenase family)